MSETDDVPTTRPVRRLRSGREVSPDYAWHLVFSGRGALLSVETRADMAAELQAALAPIAQALQRIVRDAFETIRPVVLAMHARMVEAGMAELPAVAATDDSKARALELRQRRNTGPAVHADPRRNR